jgi:ribosomal protein S18 acetylase RimI-like enzyme
MNANPDISHADIKDIEDIVALLNCSYRGERSRKGWTTEADLIGGEVRTDIRDVTAVMQQPESVFLISRADDGTLQGCVNLRKTTNKVYLGMFSVMPEQQGKGIGNTLMHKAEDWSRSHECHVIYMHVISLREELIAWYERLGYADTGARIDFREDGLSGNHLRKLEFMVMEKTLHPKDSPAST